MTPQILSEYQQGNKTARVFKLTDHYLAVGYQAGIERVSERFDLEYLAEDFCEDWVLLATPE